MGGYLKEVEKELSRPMDSYLYNAVLLLNHTDEQREDLEGKKAH